MDERRRRKFIEAYYRLRKQSSIAIDGGDKMEGQRWEHNDRMVYRTSRGWEIRIYEIEGGVEACLINPNGVSRTYG